MDILKKTNLLSQICIFSFVLVSLISSILATCVEDAPFSSFKQAYLKNTITQYEKRFSGAKAFLAHEKILGYTDEKFRPIHYLDDSIKPYYLAQYALAPVVLEPDVTTYAYTLGNFKENFNYQKDSLRNRLLLVHDFGNGVVLFRKEGK